MGVSTTLPELTPNFSTNASIFGIVTGAQRNRDWERLKRSGRWQQRLLAGNQSELQSGESLDIRSVNLFIGIESREEPRDQK